MRDQIVALIENEGVTHFITGMALGVDMYACLLYTSCYRELMPTLEYVRQEQKQEKPSIRDQLRTAAKQQPEKKSPVKSKTHDMEL